MGFAVEKSILHFNKIINAIFGKNSFVPNTTNTAEISIFFKRQNFRKSAEAGRTWPE